MLQPTSSTSIMAKRTLEKLVRCPMTQNSAEEQYKSQRSSNQSRVTLPSKTGRRPGHCVPLIWVRLRHRGGATFTEVGGTNHGERSEPENFFVVPPKRGYKYHFAPSNRGYKIIAKITRRLVQKCTTWFRSTNFTSCSPQNHCTVIFYYGTRYWPISRFCHIFLSPFTVFNAFP